MLVSYKWLKELVDVSVSTKDLAEKMSTTGIEVEGVATLSDGLSKIVVGEIISCQPIPETHLNICQVDTGEEDLRQIVCGAPNVKENSKVIVALPGARIAGNHKIKKGKIRGVVSLGMICSLDELGISSSVVPKEFADGIYHLPMEAENGNSVFPYLDMDDAIIDLAITPNRADALSMRGVAYELAAIYDKTVHFEEKELVEATKKASDSLSVSILSNKALTYQTRVIENVTIKPSPQWLQNRLMNAGIRPVNNVVDVTNYVLLYFGQPMHAFDFDKFEKDTIEVRQAKNGEPLTTLDGEERELTEHDIVISNNDKAIALAGIMGGQSTEVDPKTSTIVLEAAVFDGTSIRKTSSRLNLRSESSARFEKGINIADVENALNYAAAFITELAGGSVLSGLIKDGDLSLEDKAVSTTLEYVNRSLGTDLGQEDILSIFRRLDFEIDFNGDQFTVFVPKRRWDISIQADLIEEIARLYGYDRLPTTLPETNGTIGELTKSQAFHRTVQTMSEGLGLSEINSYSLTTAEKATAFTMEPSHLTELMWPMTEERSVLRQNMISGMLDTVAYNQARKNDSLAFYEIGKIFEQVGNPKTDLPNEITKLAFVMTGQISHKDYQTSGRQVDFFDIKGIVETLLGKLGLEMVVRPLTSLSTMHPGRTAEIVVGEESIGFVGQVHPEVAKTYRISETYVAEINLDQLESLLPKDHVFKAIPKFPAVQRDIAILVDSDVSHQAILDVIDSLNLKRLIAIKLFDVYQGEHVEEGKKSMAYRLTFQNPEATLSDEEVTRFMTKITSALAEQVAAEIR